MKILDLLNTHAIRWHAGGLARYLRKALIESSDSTIQFPEATNTSFLSRFSAKRNATPEAIHANQPTVESYYELKSPIVHETLEQNPFLIPLLCEVVPIFEKYFPGSRRSLRVAHGDLVIDITVELPVQQAYETLCKLDDEWFEVAAQRGRGKVFVQLDYEYK